MIDHEETRDFLRAVLGLVNHVDETTAVLRSRLFQAISELEVAIQLRDRDRQAEYEALGTRDLPGQMVMPMDTLCSKEGD